MWCFFGLLKLVSLLPYRTAIAAGRGLGRIIYVLTGPRKRIVDTNLARCFPELAPDERERIKRACYHNIGISLVEMAMTWWWSCTVDR